MSFIQSFKFLQVSTAYAVWIGVGTAGAVLINMIFFDESKSAGKVASVILIVIGVVGLKYVSWLFSPISLHGIEVLLW